MLPILFAICRSVPLPPFTRKLARAPSARKGFLQRCHRYCCARGRPGNALPTWYRAAIFLEFRRLDQSVQNFWAGFHEATLRAEISNNALYRASLPPVAVAHASQPAGSGKQMVVYQSGCSGPLLKFAIHIVSCDIGDVESSCAPARTDAGATVMACEPVCLSTFVSHWHLSVF